MDVARSKGKWVEVDYGASMAERNGDIRGPHARAGAVGLVGHRQPFAHRGPCERVSPSVLPSLRLALQGIGEPIASGSENIHFSSHSGAPITATKSVLSRLGTDHRVSPHT
jgi:hypothetical protein